jgi:hypothetical protein
MRRLLVEFPMLRSSYTTNSFPMLDDTLRPLAGLCSLGFPVVRNVGVVRGEATNLPSA